MTTFSLTIDNVFKYPEGKTSEFDEVLYVFNIKNKMHYIDEDGILYHLLRLPQRSGKDGMKLTNKNAIKKGHISNFDISELKEKAKVFCFINEDNKLISFIDINFNVLISDEYIDTKIQIVTKKPDKFDTFTEGYVFHIVDGKNSITNFSSSNKMKLIPYKFKNILKSNSNYTTEIIISNFKAILESCSEENMVDIFTALSSMLTISRNNELKYNEKAKTTTYSDLKYIINNMSIDSIYVDTDSSIGDVESVMDIEEFAEKITKQVDKELGKCQGVKKNGDPCTRNAKNGTNFCHSHS